VIPPFRAIDLLKVLKTKDQDPKKSDIAERRREIEGGFQE